MLVLIDIGNTTVGLSIYNNKDITCLKIIDTLALKEKKIDLENEYKGLFDKVDDCFISSVVPSLNNCFKSYFKKNFDIEPLFLNIAMNKKYHINLDQPNELGSDLLAAIYGSSKYFNEAIVVDLGTASKFLIIKNDEFLGGAIAPGFEGSINSLFNNAEMLNEFKMEDASKVVGNSTMECITNGSIFGMVSLVEGMVERIKKETNIQNVILTGGSIVHILKHLSFKYLYAPNLIYEGLLLIYEYQK